MSSLYLESKYFYLEICLACIYDFFILSGSPPFSSRKIWKKRELSMDFSSSLLNFNPYFFFLLFFFLFFFSFFDKPLMNSLTIKREMAYSIMFLLLWLLFFFNSSSFNFSLNLSLHILIILLNKRIEEDFFKKKK